MTVSPRVVSLARTMACVCFVAASAAATWCVGAPEPTGTGQVGRIRRRLERACGGVLPMPAWPTAGYLLEMEAVGEVFHVWVTSAAGMAHLQQWLASEPKVETLGIPGAPIELDGSFNPGFRYRMKPGEVTFAENWIELCDGTPCAVQRGAVEWVVNPSTWCPWSSRVRAVWSCEGGTGQSCGAPVFVAPGQVLPVVWAAERQD